MEGFGFSFASSTTAVYNDLDKTMLSHYGMNAATGIYSMAYRVVDFATMPIFAIRDAALPGLFKRGHQGITKSAEYGHRLLVRTLSLGVLASLCLALAAPLIPKLVGSGFSESVSALRWLAIIPVFRSIHQMSGIVLTSCGRQTVRTASQLTAAGLNFGLNLWLIPRFGWHGAAWASIATDGALALMNWSILKVLVMRSSARLAPSLTA
jgi:O-antigen/teichoic acid export membrane protein